jgi:hypothetical protein
VLVRVGLLLLMLLAMLSLLALLERVLHAECVRAGCVGQGPNSATAHSSRAEAHVSNNLAQMTQVSVAMLRRPTAINLTPTPSL